MVSPPIYKGRTNPAVESIMPSWLALLLLGQKAIHGKDPSTEITAHSLREQLQPLTEGSSSQMDISRVDTWPADITVSRCYKVNVAASGEAALVGKSCRKRWGLERLLSGPPSILVTQKYPLGSGMPPLPERREFMFWEEEWGIPITSYTKLGISLLAVMSGGCWGSQGTVVYVGGRGIS